ncbi:MAG TPA: hypothetical protein VFC95_00815 [Guyparkeria sp.]|nr:hypothetical protein [Guyparkeria sp.]
MRINSSRQKMPMGGLRHWATTHLSGFALATALLFAPQLAAAQTMVFDRGLPTENLNKDVGPDRSNVTWDSATKPTWLIGDDFMPPGTEAYVVKTIRVWAMGKSNEDLTQSNDLSLFGGPTGGTIETLSTTYTSTPATYTGGNKYQGNSGDYRDFYQIDFTVNIPLNGGEEFQFFVGPAGTHVHASNKDTSGSTQEGADNQVLRVNPENGEIETMGTTAPVSDINVQVFAQTQAEGTVASIPTMSNLGLAGMALMLAGAGLFFMRGRRDI